VSNMKTTVDLPEPLLREAQAAARRDHTTLKALIEAGLRAVLADRSRTERFSLRDASVGGRGRQNPFRDARWEEIREAIYERPT
jgi:hypothetical protein